MRWRAVVAPPSVAAAAEGHGGQARPACPPGVFCVYRAPDYQGPSWSWTGCGARETPLAGVGAYVNNTLYWVRMFDRREDIVFTAPPCSEAASFDWTGVWYLQIC
ncbi:peptidase inhibitor family I36 protein [Streptomyces sp. NPDC001205]